DRVGGGRRGVVPARLELLQLAYLELRAGHADAESALVEQTLDFHARPALRVDAAEQRVALSVLGLELPEAALEVAKFKGSAHFHRSGSRASSPRPTTQATIALASSQNGAI